MIRIQSMSYKGVKMIKLKANREHRNFHINSAEKMREKAREWKETAIKAQEAFGIDATDEIEAAYNNMLAEAIAEENRNCMKGQH